VSILTLKVLDAIDFLDSLLSCQAEGLNGPVGVVIHLTYIPTLRAINKLKTQQGVQRVKAGLCLCPNLQMIVQGLIDFVETSLALITPTPEPTGFGEEDNATDDIHALVFLLALWVIKYCF